MFKDIPNIEPIGEDITIWRYMDLASFMSLILKKQLMFKRANHFKDYYDTFVDLDDESVKSIIKALEEGEKSPGSFYKVKKIDKIKSETIDTSVLRNSIQPFFSNGKISLLLNEIGQPVSLSDITYCSSWHENDHENYALWKVYLGNKPEGVAIKSSVKRIKDVLDKDKDRVFYIGKVKYTSNKINIFGDKLSDHTIVLTKREEYEYEKEVRIYTIDEERKNTEPYLYLSIANINDLIEELWISPFTGKWLSDVVLDFLLQNKINVQVKSSFIKER